MFLQRVIRCQLADKESEDFDNVVTTTALEIMGIGAHETLEYRARVETLRGMPVHLSGGGISHLAGDSVRVKALKKARVNMMDYLNKPYTTIGAAICKRWDGNALQVCNIEPVDGWVPMQTDDVVTGALKGHTLGTVPDDAVTYSVLCTGRLA